MLVKSDRKKTIRSKKSQFSNVFAEKLDYLNEKRTVFADQLNYINREEKDYVVFHNLQTRTNDIKAIEQELKENFQRFHAKKRNMVILYHDKIAFHPRDRSILIRNPNIALDIAKKWLELRVSQCLGYAKLHFDKAHIHAHVIYSSNEIGSSKQCWIYQRPFKRLQWQLERYKREKYPQLVPYDFYKEGYERQGIKKTNSEQEMERREGKPSRKQQVHDILKKIFFGCTIHSKQEFIETLKQHHLGFFERGRKSVGIIDLQKPMKNGEYRKHKFETLGLLKEWQQCKNYWLNRHKMLEQMEKIEINRAKVFVRYMGFEEDLRDILSSEMIMTDTEKRILLDLRQNRRIQREGIISRSLDLGL